MGYLMPLALCQRSMRSNTLLPAFAMAAIAPAPPCYTSLPPAFTCRHISHSSSHLLHFLIHHFLVAIFFPLLFLQFHLLWAEQLWAPLPTVWNSAPALGSLTNGAGVCQGLNGCIIYLLIGLNFASQTGIAWALTLLMYIGGNEWSKQ